MFFCITDACQQTRRETVNWSLCSQQCGLGLSTRWTTDTVDCRNITQVRLCFWRPCQAIKLASISRFHSQARSFVPTLKFVRPGYLKFTTPYGDPNNLLSGAPSNSRQTESTDKEYVKKDSLTMCQLERAIRPRFCNRPTNPTEACCWPTHVKTKRLRFHCTGGTEVYHFFEWIQLCRCVRAPCERVLHSSDWQSDDVL
ncbi:uncharacterized protein DEA37_0003433 [Paragonimus westermani]|uniref:CTCK domain-containing protein n=1 Tax=Paragonimus westermani TaxID=34504 RepID=A0A5J4NSQ7_9TREM|nr:uncharacterized protein DEA37_0003433 [Paragonimus westermani]